MGATKNHPVTDDNGKLLAVVHRDPSNPRFFVADDTDGDRLDLQDDFTSMRDCVAAVKDQHRRGVLA